MNVNLYDIFELPCAVEVWIFCNICTVKPWFIIFIERPEKEQCIQEKIDVGGYIK
jgi:hypothetical protein